LIKFERGYSKQFHLPTERFLTLSSLGMNETVTASTTTPIFQRNARFYHRTIASFFVFQLLLVALTGFTYRWFLFFGFPKESVKWLLVIHEGKFFSGFELVWTFCGFLGVLALISTGYFMIRDYLYLSFGIPSSARQLHQNLSSFIVAPLALTSMTGFFYRLGRWLGYEKMQVNWLLVAHEGKLIPGMEILWTLFLLSGVLSMGISGLKMLGWWKTVTKT